MNGHFGQLDQSFKALWINNRGAVSKNQKLSDLGPEAIGVFPADVVNGKGEPVSLSVPSFKNHSKLILKQGLHPTLGSKNPIITRTDGKPRETSEFTASDIVEWRGKKGQKGSVGEIVVIGYDGLDASQDLAKGVKLDAKPMYLNMTLSGEPIKRFFGKSYINHRIAINKDLCIGDCDCYDACGKVDSNLIADKIIREIETGYLQTPGPKGLSTVYLSSLLKVSKIRKCAEGITLPTVATKEYKKWQITIPTAFAGAAGQLASKNPTLVIDQENRGLGEVTYTTWTDTTVTTLPDITFTDYLLPVCDTCPDCPVESEQFAGVRKVQVRVPKGVTPATINRANPAYDPENPGSVPATISAQISRILYSSDIFTGDVYIVTVHADTTDAEITSALDATSILDILEDTSIYCVGPDTTFSWATCESAFTTTKEFELVLNNHHCDKEADRLEEVQAAYPELVVTVKQVGTCITSYKTTIESDKLPAEDCDKEFGTFRFVKPASYQGFAWKELTPVNEFPVCTPAEEDEKPCCVTGLMFETARWDEDLAECGFGYTSWSPTLTKPIKLQLNVHSLDWSGNPCDEVPIYSKVLQKATFEKGTDGRLVQEWEKIQLHYENGNGWRLNPYANDALNVKFTAVPEAIYDVYYLTIKRKQFGTSHGWSNQNKTTYAFPVISGQGKEFEEYMNQLVLSAGNPKLKAVIL